MDFPISSLTKLNVEEICSHKILKVLLTAIENYEGILGYGYKRSTIKKKNLRRSIELALLSCEQKGNLAFISINRKLAGWTTFLFSSEASRDYILFRHCEKNQMYLLGVDPECIGIDSSSKGFVKEARIYYTLAVISKNRGHGFTVERFYMPAVADNAAKKEYFLPEEAKSSKQRCCANASPICSLKYHHLTGLSFSQKSFIAESSDSRVKDSKWQSISQKLTRISTPSKKHKSEAFHTSHSDCSNARMLRRSQQLSSYGKYSCVKQAYSDCVPRFFVQHATSCETERWFRRAVSIAAFNGPLKGVSQLCRPVAATRVESHKSCNVAIFPYRSGDLVSLLHYPEHQNLRAHLSNDPLEFIKFISAITTAIRGIHRCTSNLSPYNVVRDSNLRPEKGWTLPAEYSAAFGKSSGLVHSDIKLENILFQPYERSLHSGAISTSDIFIELTDFDGLTNEGTEMQGNTTPGYVSPQLEFAYKNGIPYYVRQSDDCWALGEVLRRICKVLLHDGHSKRSFFQTFMLRLVNDLQQTNEGNRLNVEGAYKRLQMFASELRSLYNNMNGRTYSIQKPILNKIPGRNLPSITHGLEVDPNCIETEATKLRGTHGNTTYANCAVLQDHLKTADTQANFTHPAQTIISSKSSLQTLNDWENNQSRGKQKHKALRVASPSAILKKHEKDNITKSQLFGLETKSDTVQTKLGNERAVENFPFRKEKIGKENLYTIGTLGPYIDTEKPGVSVPYFSSSGNLEFLSVPTYVSKHKVIKLREKNKISARGGRIADKQKYNKSEHRNYQNGVYSTIDLENHRSGLREHSRWKKTEMGSMPISTPSMISQQAILRIRDSIDLYLERCNAKVPEESTSHATTVCATTDLYEVSNETTTIDFELPSLSYQPDIDLKSNSTEGNDFS
ncbi:hypothetical protein IE077_003902 [Cardiosporidium cionae]|uniref:Protein kinase domain-containing protein n=1 Tax=Cardiosporidium cionae TaxID=476202 RepID=A0ABQ7J793_9APIC|nr:hypothetical protein IE077_003902 [Cardiosporidium cionae]|eukprot:KAF8819846.1 hypothetical protein IE077_003902 [Cardiosporidium cionae]